MAKKAAGGGLELDADMAFQRGMWTAQRIAWGIFALIVVLALMGFTGRGGPLSRTRAELSGGTIAYPRIARWEAPATFQVDFAPGAEGRLFLSRAFFDDFAVTDIEPQPAESRLTAGGQVLSFSVGPDGGRALLHVRPERPALPLRMTARIDEGPPDSLATYVLP
jgi:hypothetical protein